MNDVFIKVIKDFDTETETHKTLIVVGKGLPILRLTDGEAERLVIGLRWALKETANDPISASVPDEAMS